MGRPSLMLLIFLAAIGSWFFFNELPSGPSAASRGAASVWPENVTDSQAGGQSPLPSAMVKTRRVDDTIRIASFQLDGFGVKKASQQDLLQIIAQIIRSFDVVALQEIRSREQHVITTLLDAVNGPTDNYDFALGPVVGRLNSKEQFAFIYDRRRLDFDRYELYTVKDPDDLLHSEPLVAWFRARGVPTNEAFTFSLVNMHTDPTMGETVRENRLLRKILQSVRNDQRGEDDVILLGDFQTSADDLQAAAQMPSATYVISETHTDPAHRLQRDNIIFESLATVEFTGRSGVVDFLRILNLSVEQATKISNHLPVWAEFSVYEGQGPRRVANADGESNPH